MRKYVLIGLILLGLAVLGVMHLPTSPAPVQPTVVAAAPVTQEPRYTVGDDQAVDGGWVTLDAVYAPATPLTSMDEVPSQDMLVAVEWSGNVSAAEERLYSTIYTSDGQYVKALGGNVKECEDCAVFIVPKNVYIDTAFYKSFKWYL